MIMVSNEEKGSFERYYIDYWMMVIESEWFVGILFILIFLIGLYFKYS